jgi:uncharacterized integral membrane protein
VTARPRLAVLHPILAWLGALIAAVTIGVFAASPIFSLSLWRSVFAIVAIPSALWTLLVIWFARRLALPRPVPDVLGAMFLALLLAGNWAPPILALGCGFVAGLTYWVLAGLPRSPYRDEPKSI